VLVLAEKAFPLEHLDYAIAQMPGLIPVFRQAAQTDTDALAWALQEVAHGSHERLDALLSRPPDALAT
jgi:hypothetical protein